VPEDHRTLFSIRLLTVALVTVVHVTLALTFLAFGHLPMAAVDGIALVVNLVGLAMAFSGRDRAALLLTVGEVYVHMAVATVLLGLRTGYMLYCFSVFGLVYVVFYPRERAERAAVLAVSIALPVVFLAWEPTPLRPLGVAQSAGLFWANVLSVGAVLLLVAAYSAAVTARAQARFAEEHARAERLLLNILPPSVAARLKRSQATIADSFETATVLFADIVGFTPLAARLSGTELVEMLNELFSAFDRLTERHGLEKIKTIGDAYMVVGGAPVPTPDHARAVVAMALEMLAAVRDYSARTGRALDVRIGVHTGPVVAGVIGVRKFAYDLWGETVNTASRLESHGAPGRVHLSETTRAALAGSFATVPRGAIKLKGIGETNTYFLAEAGAGA
jgi:class 3 adenylate cyclase